MSGPTRPRQRERRRPDPFDDAPRHVREFDARWAVAAQQREPGYSARPGDPPAVWAWFAVSAWQQARLDWLHVHRPTMTNDEARRVVLAAGLPSDLDVAAVLVRDDLIPRAVR